MNALQRNDMSPYTILANDRIAACACNATNAAEGMAGTPTVRRKARVSRSRPPTMATWLLERLHCRLDDESLMGDLFEEYCRGRSRIWYWKEVVTAIALGFCRELAAHPVLALRAIALAWAVRYLYVYSVARTALTHVSPWGVTQWLWWTAVRPVGLMEMIWWAMDSAVCAMSGWIVARFHNANRIPMVLATAVSVFLFQLTGLPWIWFHAKNGFTNTRFLPYLVTDFVALVLPPLCTLVGGLWSALPEREREVSGNPIPESKVPG